MKENCISSLPIYVTRSKTKNDRWNKIVILNGEKVSEWLKIGKVKCYVRHTARLTLWSYLVYDTYKGKLRTIVASVDVLLQQLRMVKCSAVAREAPLQQLGLMRWGGALPLQRGRGPTPGGEAGQPWSGNRRGSPPGRWPVRGHDPAGGGRRPPGGAPDEGPPGPRLPASKRSSSVQACTMALPCT